MLEPRLDQLPPSQRSLWPALSEVPSGFVLYGGTALTLRLGHRLSEDFDLFANRSFQPDELEREVPFLHGSFRFQSSPNTLVSRVERPEGATKVKVVQDRAESKDYLDIFRILEEGIELSVALTAARAVYGAVFNPLLSLKALTYFGDGDLGTLPEKVRARLATAASSVDPTSLPEISARPGGLLT